MVIVGLSPQIFLHSCKGFICSFHGMQRLEVGSNEWMTLIAVAAVEALTRGPARA